MNKTIQRVLYFLLALVALSFLLFPIINTTISKKYHLVISENGNSDVYTVDISETEITVSTNQYNNLATEKKGHDETTHTSPLSEENYRRLAAAFCGIAGAHISVRWHPGYVFFYEDAGNASAFYQLSDHESFIELARIASNLALGDTEMTTHNKKQTYVEYGTSQLKSFLEARKIEFE